MTPVATRTGACWADPLSRSERRTLAEKLARANGSAWRAGAFPTSTEMALLYMDVDEPAEVAAS